MDKVHTSNQRWTNKSPKSDDFFKALDENKNIDIPIDSGMSHVELEQSVADISGEATTNKESRGDKN